MAGFNSLTDKANSWWNRLTDTEQQIYQDKYYPELDFNDVASDIKMINTIFLKELINDE